MRLDGGEYLVAVAAFGDDFEAVVGSEDAGDAGAHDGLVVDDDRADHGATGSAIGTLASTRQPSAVGPASH